jgi:putative intracellular protease/amidase
MPHAYFAIAAVVATAAIAARTISDPPKPDDERERNVAIVIYPDVELLDFAGPGEVFAASHSKAGHLFHVYTVAESLEPCSSMGFLKVTPQYTFENCPKPDIVVVPGGHVPLNSVKLRDWVRAQSKDAELMMSVCNGALVYASAGLLKGLEVTTHRSALQNLALTEPEARVYTNRRFVDNGRVMTSAGISAGIDGALHVVGRLCGEETAWETARYMEYDWRPDEIAKLHAQAGAPVEGAESLKWVSSIRRTGLQGALAEYKKLANPPSEKDLNTWGYTLLRQKKVDDAVEVLRLAAAAFPMSANAADSLSEALEARADKDGAMKAAQDCLARLEKDKDADEARRAILRNAASSRVARLSGAPAAKLRFFCPPCSSSCDEVGYLEATRCPGCPMQLVERTQE